MQRRLVTTADGHDLAVYETGDPAGPELLMIHGVAQSHLCFAGQYPALGHCRIVAYDLLGHGASAKPDAPQRYRDGRRWAEDLHTVIAATGLRRPVLVGWSFGGRMIRQYLIHYGDARLAGINFVGSRVIEHPDAAGAGWARIGAGAQETPPDLARHIDAAIAFLSACFHRPPDEAAFRVALAYNMVVPMAVRDAIAGWSTGVEETVAALKRVTVPTLVTQGRQDTVVRPVAAEMVVAAMPTARLSWYADSGHSPFVEERERFNRELADFVAEAWRG